MHAPPLKSVFLRNLYLLLAMNNRVVGGCASVLPPLTMATEKQAWERSQSEVTLLFGEDSRYSE